MGGLLGGIGYVAPPLSNYWEGGPAPPPLRLCMSTMIPMDQKICNLHYNEVRGDFLTAATESAHKQ